MKGKSEISRVWRACGIWRHTSAKRKTYTFSNVGVKIFKIYFIGSCWNKTTSEVEKKKQNEVRERKKCHYKCNLHTHTHTHPKSGVGEGRDRHSIIMNQVNWFFLSRKLVQLFSVNYIQPHSLFSPPLSTMISGLVQWCDIVRDRGIYSFYHCTHFTYIGTSLPRF